MATEAVAETGYLDKIDAMETVGNPGLNWDSLQPYVG
jgi:hypothetical protein